MLLATRSVTTRNWPLGLKASDAPPVVVPVRKAGEFFIGVVVHDEDGAGCIFELGRGESWKCGANSDGEHEETSSYLQHLLLLGKTIGQNGCAKAKRGVG